MGLFSSAAAAAFAILLASPGFLPPAAHAGEDPNLFTYGAGATVIEAAPASVMSAFAAIDGDDRAAAVGIPRRQPLPHSFVVELPAATTFSRFEVAPIDEFGSAKGRHIKHVALEASATSATEGFTPLLSFELAAGVKGPQSFPVPGEPRAVRWVRVRFADTFEPAKVDHQPHRFSDLRGFGSQAPITVADGAFTGLWRLRRKGINDEPGRNIIELWQRGSDISGCRRMGGQPQKIAGTIVDGIARLVATTDQGPNEPFTAQIASDGQLTGVSFSGPPRAFYAAPAPDAEVSCKPPEKVTNPIQDALDAGQVAIIHGIHFDVDKDVLRPDAKPALDQLLGALTASPKLTVTIEGHTDSQGSDAHNLDLSNRRAKAVITWLTAKGIDAGRLSAVGKGETEPIADNAVSAGRALNRRVEVEPR